MIVLAISLNADKDGTYFSVAKKAISSKITEIPHFSLQTVNPQQSDLNAAISALDGQPFLCVVFSHGDSSGIQGIEGSGHLIDASNFYYFGDAIVAAFACCSADCLRPIVNEHNAKLVVGYEGIVHLPVSDIGIKRFLSAELSPILSGETNKLSQVSLESEYESTFQEMIELSMSEKNFILASRLLSGKNKLRVYSRRN